MLLFLAKKHRESLKLFVVVVDNSWFICVYYKLGKTVCAKSMFLNDSNSQQRWNLLQTGCFETLKTVNHALLTFKWTQCNISLWYMQSIYLISNIVSSVFIQITLKPHVQVNFLPIWEPKLNVVEHNALTVKSTLLCHLCKWCVEKE